MKHATLNAMFSIWVGADFFDWPEEISLPEEDLLAEEDTASSWVRVCDLAVIPAFEAEVIPMRDILRVIPTCPRCAVLYDEAMQAREELLGRAAA